MQQLSELERHLNTQERRFLLAHVEGASLTEAYLLLRPGIERESAKVLGCRMLKRIVRKASWSALLEEAGLGDARIMRGLEAALSATKKIFFEGKEIAEVPDNGTRMDALVLLADLLGRRKAELTVHQDVVTILPAPRPEEIPGEDEESAPASGETS